MGRGTTAYIRKVESRDKIDELIQSFKSVAVQNKIDFTKEKKGNHGFVGYININADPFIYFTDTSILKLKYGYYHKNINRDPTSNEKYRYDYIDFDIWFDAKHRIAMFFTSRFAIAAMVMNIMESAGIKLNFTQYSEAFFRWIDKGYKPQQSFRLLLANGTHIDSLEMDQYTDSLTITTFDELSKSPAYKLVENDGDRKYFKGIFKLKDSQYVAKVYKNGKITIDKQVVGIKDDTKFVFPWIYEDVVNIHRYWKSLSQKGAKVI